MSAFNMLKSLYFSEAGSHHSLKMHPRQDMHAFFKGLKNFPPLSERLSAETTFRVFHLPLPNSRFRIDKLIKLVGCSVHPLQRRPGHKWFL